MLATRTQHVRHKYTASIQAFSSSYFKRSVIASVFIIPLLLLPVAWEVFSRWSDMYNLSYAWNVKYICTDIMYQCDNVKQRPRFVSQTPIPPFTFRPLRQFQKHFRSISLKFNRMKSLFYLAPRRVCVSLLLICISCLMLSHAFDTLMNQQIN